MDLFPDFKDLLAAFADLGARYVLIGGYAVVFHGRPRATKDIDLLVSVDEYNRELLARALETFGAPSNVAQSVRTMTAKDIVFFGVSPLRVDLRARAALDGMAATIARGAAVEPELRCRPRINDCHSERPGARARSRWKETAPRVRQGGRGSSRDTYWSVVPDSEPGFRLGDSLIGGVGLLGRGCQRPRLGDFRLSSPDRDPFLHEEPHET